MEPGDKAIGKPGKLPELARNVFLVGIKGTGMSAMAELLVARGAKVGGSDTDERFYTDAILKDLGIEYFETFDPEHITREIELVIYSSAYPRDSHPELARASALGIPVLSYTEALGELSSGCDASGITGMHGKSTVTAISGTLARSLNLPATVVAGTAVPTFGNRSTVTNGTEFLIAETCEYRRHFLSFHPDRIVVTNIELEHTDYFASIEDVHAAFAEYAERMPSDGTLIYCADDDGASLLAKTVKRSKPGVTLVPYGTTADGPFSISEIVAGDGVLGFKLGLSSRRFELKIPGLHNLRNSAAAIALMSSIYEKKHGSFGQLEIDACAAGLAGFRGSRRRSQIVGNRDGVLFLDDYGHHPTEIRTTIAGFRDFYPGRRLIVDFMPHLYSRTKDLFDGFLEAFDEADIVISHRIYASAREKKGTVTGRDLAAALKKRRDNTFYFHEVNDAREFCREMFRSGDVFVTMGAGDNWKLGADLASLDAGNGGGEL